MSTEKNKETTKSNATSPTAEKFKPHKVYITAPALNVRKGPGTDTEIVKTLINDGDVHNIVEESEGPGASVWCKLESGIGWISGDHVKKK